MPWSYGHLMFSESRVIISTMLRLAREHDTLALPVHDSLIVPRSKEEIAERILDEQFTQIIGVKPTLKICPLPEVGADGQKRLRLVNSPDSGGLDRERRPRYITLADGPVCKTLGLDCKTPGKSVVKSVTSVGNSVTVAQQTLTLFV
jgi:hypothetical protein